MSRRADALISAHHAAAAALAANSPTHASHVKAPTATITNISHSSSSSNLSVGTASASSPSILSKQVQNFILPALGVRDGNNSSSSGGRDVGGNQLADNYSNENRLATPDPSGVINNYNNDKR